MATVLKFSAAHATVNDAATIGMSMVAAARI
jgi:hypothetical protein